MNNQNRESVQFTQISLVAEFLKGNLHYFVISTKTI